MPGLAQELCTLFLVAVVADRWLGFQAQDRVILLVQIMAVHAGNTFYIVDTAGPVKPGGIVVAAQTGVILRFYRCLIIKGDGG